MTEQQKPRVKLPPVQQVSIVVKDMDKAIEYYSSTFGLGPFRVMDIDMEGVLLRGKPISTKIKVAFARSGSLQVELIQPVEGENIYTEFLDSKGEGLHHLGFQVDDLDGMLAELAKEGIQPVFRKGYPDRGIAFTYLNSDKIGGVIFELIEQKTMRREKDEQ
jgi:methylmalonyl-CoA/ethylmalonyl-CoA epimerase